MVCNAAYSQKDCNCQRVCGRSIAGLAPTGVPPAPHGGNSGGFFLKCLAGQILRPPWRIWQRYTAITIIIQFTWLNLEQGAALLYWAVGWQTAGVTFAEWTVTERWVKRKNVQAFLRRMPWVRPLWLKGDTLLLWQYNHSFLSPVAIMVTLTADLLILVYCSSGTVIFDRFQYRSSAVSSVVLTITQVAVKLRPISSSGDSGSITRLPVNQRSPDHMTLLLL